MAVLSDADRAAVAAEFMQQATGPLTILKPDVRAAVNGLDDWYNANAAAANQALPQPARSNLSQADKALMSNLIVSKRYVKGS
ncbi:MAG TPA: hypothetical protein VF077_12630 [Nitrospiraceae bacterium]